MKLKVESILEIEKKIGYDFINNALLQQAFTRRSYSEENGGPDNEVLEFIGDKVLDLVVIKLMMEVFSNYTFERKIEDLNIDKKFFETKLKEGKFTEIKIKLVESKSLADAISRLGLEQYLIMGNGDIQEHVEEQDSVKEDLFEAILGAIATDCSYDIEILEKVADKMLNIVEFLKSLDSNIDYKKIVNEYSKYKYNESPIVKFFEDEGDYSCLLTMNDTNRYLCISTRRELSEWKAYKQAYDLLVKTHQIAIDKSHIIDDYDIVHPSLTLNNLIQINKIEKPEFKYYQEDDGTWIAQMYCLDTNQYYESNEIKKNEAKEDCIIKYLNYLCGDMPYEVNVLDDSVFVIKK